MQNLPSNENELAIKYLYLIDRQMAWLRKRIKIHLDWDDVRSHLQLGFVRAIRKYRPELPAAIETWITGYLRGYWRHYWRDKKAYYLRMSQLTSGYNNCGEIEMALYDRQCTHCGHWEEVIEIEADELIECPKCGKIAMRRLPSCPAVISVCDSDNKSALQTANLLEKRREAAAAGHGNLTIKCTANQRGEITIDDVVQTGGQNRRSALTAKALE